MQRIHLLGEKVLGSQERLCSKESDLCKIISVE